MTTLKVTPHHIEQGTIKDSSHCPMAYCLIEALNIPNRYISVDHSLTTIDISNDKQVWEHLESLCQRTFDHEAETDGLVELWFDDHIESIIETYDLTGKMKPFNFTYDSSIEKFVIVHEDGNKEPEP